MARAFFSAILPIAALLLGLLGYGPSPQKGPGNYVGNLHTHTTASDGTASYSQVVRRAARLGMDFIAITDHDTISPETLFYCPEEQRIKCFVGEEVSTSDGHVLAIGIYEVIPPGLSAAETIDRIHAQGGLAIPAHPGYLNMSLFPGEIEGLPFDAVECNVKTWQPGVGYSCQSIKGFPRVYSSDAHTLEELELVASECEMTGLDFESLAAAIASEKCEEYIPAGH
ncbi:MAG: PHP domain-containing protein [archaeon]